MKRSARGISVTLFILTSAVLHAQEGEKEPKLDFLNAGDARFIAVIQDLGATPFSKLLPRTQCGSFDCEDLAEHMGHAGLDWGDIENPGEKIWVIEVKPKKLAHEWEPYDPNNKYKFQLLELAKCGPASACPEPGPGPDPVNPMPNDPPCGPSDVCPEPGLGKGILDEINRGHLIPVQGIPLNWSSKRYVKRLINATEQSGQK